MYSLPEHEKLKKFMYSHHTCTHAINTTHTHTHTQKTKQNNNMAQVVADQVKRMRRELTQAREVSPQIDAIILLDRSVDFLTPLSTPLTYEALIDEVYGIKNCE